MIKLVIFDMAGTAIKEDNLVYKTIQSTMVDHGVEVDLETVLEIAAGKEKWEAIFDLLSHQNANVPSSEFVDTIHTAFKENLDNAYDHYEMSVFPSVREVIDILRKSDIQVAFNTGYSRTVAEKILSKVGLKEGEDIDLMVTASEVKLSRPAPDMIHKICDQLKIKPSAVIKVGDSGIDILEGKNAEVKFSIGITTGAQTRKQLQVTNPDYILDDMMELLPLLQQMEEEV